MERLCHPINGGVPTKSKCSVSIQMVRFPNSKHTSRQKCVCSSEYKEVRVSKQNESSNDIKCGVGGNIRLQIYIICVRVTNRKFWHRYAEAKVMTPPNTSVSGHQVITKVILLGVLAPFIIPEDNELEIL